MIYVVLVMLIILGVLLCIGIFFSYKNNKIELKIFELDKEKRAFEQLAKNQDMDLKMMFIVSKIFVSNNHFENFSEIKQDTLFARKILFAIKQMISNESEFEKFLIEGQTFETDKNFEGKTEFKTSYDLKLILIKIIEFMRKNYNN